ncbi:FAD-binding oxidoreductase [Kribbella albertanoniae]|uniref:FAD-binding oxidoreductase n=1 Tax=Kribbella albertanoniae TaxID=1266829 RepID=A0A4R4QDQ4_9ACTN|nr:FAD-binding oxidoreductase [Kribbella albertanoniae]TDC33540.1 FAD-binding oxidoreductase [Kribbella albertanoniae]
MNQLPTDQLAAQMRGEIVVPGDPGYDDARHVYNGMIDRRPAVIAHCRGVADVVHSVRFAVAHDLPVAIRGGGHSVAGHGTCDDGLLVDLSGMRDVRVDPVAQTVRVSGGATLADLDANTQLFGLATPSGQVSMTGIGGLALTGGMGMLQRRYGLTCDNLLSADVVTADGTVVTASADSHPELFWALRGGGGNFGVVTSFEFRCHPVGPTILAGMVAWPVEQAPEVLAFLRDFIVDTPEELSADAVIQFAPPLDVIPEEHRGRRLIGIFLRYFGTDLDPEIVRPVQEFGSPVLDFIYPMPYVAVQQLLDPLNPNGNLHYWTGEYLPELGTKQIETLSTYAATLPTDHSIMQVIPFDNAVTRVEPDATAFSHRQDSWLIHVMAQWTDPTDTDRCRSWAKQAGADLRAVGSGDSYLNLVTDEEDVDRVSAFWNEARLSRLAAVKAQYDPNNTFRFNHNIKPA